MLPVLADVAAGDQLPVLLDHEHTSARIVDQGGDLIGADPRPADQV